MLSRTIISSILILIAVSSQAQISDTSYNGVNDVFSYYGYGTYNMKSLQTGAMMGYTGVAHRSALEVNNVNPASIADLRVTTMDFSLKGISSRTTNANESKPSGNFRPAYFYLSYPIGKKAGMSLGMDQKYTTLYRLKSSDQLNFGDSILQVDKVQLGNGSVNNLSASGAYKFSGFTLGARLNYNFGNRKVEDYVAFTDTTDIFGTDYISNYQVRGLSFDFGAQYTYYGGLDSTHRVTAGITYTPNSNSRVNEEYYKTNFFISNVLTVDTFGSESDRSSTAVMPSELSFGLGYIFDSRLSVLIDYQTMNYSKAKIFDQALDLNNYSRFAFGTSFLPSLQINSSSSVFSRSIYRLGFYTGKDYVKANSNDVKFWGVTGGLSVPFRRNLGNVHLGIEYNMRGDVSSNLVRMQNTFYTIGISFSDIWFQKRYYN